MPRSGTGTYTLPSGNPVVTGTTIESTWANTTLSDIATTLSDSLSRSGQGGMTAALRIADGTQGAPGVGFANETGSGFYRAGTGEVWAVVQGAQTLNLDASGVTVPSDKATSIEGTFVFNETGADKDARFEGDTDANLLFVDASTDRVGIGTSSPVAKLTISGNQSFSNTTYQIGYALNTETGTVAGANSPFYGLNMATFTGFSGNGIGLHGYYGLLFSTAGTERMRLDSSGNLGLGVTPSAWAIIKAIEIGSFRNALYSDNGSVSVGIVSGAYYNAGWKYALTGSNVGRYEIAGNAHTWFNAPSGTAGNAITFTQAMTLDADGELGIGTTSPSCGLDVRKQETSAYNTARFSNGTDVQFLDVVCGRALTNGTVGGVSSSLVMTLRSSGSSAGNLAFATGNDERARITQGGNFGIGQTSPQTALGFANAATISWGTTNYPYISGDQPNNTLVFGTQATERARITSGGELLVGLSAATFVSTRLEVQAETNNNALGAKTTQNNYAPLMAWNSATTGDNLFQYFYTEGTLTLRGSIDYNRAGGLVRYNTTSDYRAKDIIGPVQNPGATIDALKVYEGVMKGATQSRPMLIAHEAQAHAPYAVSGVKDEVNEDGTPKFQQIDVSSLVPLLLAEIQSLRARVAALEAA